MLYVKAVVGVIGSRPSTIARDCVLKHEPPMCFTEDIWTALHLENMSKVRAGVLGKRARRVG